MMLNASQVSNLTLHLPKMHARDKDELQRRDYSKVIDARRAVQ